MAMFGREELGKYRMLREKYEVVATGGTVKAKELVDRKSFLNHEEKHKRALGGISLRPEPGSPLDQALRATFEHAWGSPERERAEVEIQVAAEKLAKELPKKRHDLRMKALYVNLSDDQTRWIRPQDVKAEDAKDEVLQAICAFNNALLRLDERIDTECEFVTAYFSWAERPQISAIELSW